VEQWAEIRRLLLVERRCEPEIAACMARKAANCADYPLGAASRGAVLLPAAC